MLFRSFMNGNGGTTVCAAKPEPVAGVYSHAGKSNRMGIEMERVAVVTDSNSGITQKEGRGLGISVLPMPFMIDGETYFEDISLTQEEFYERLRAGADISTSQPVAGDVIDLWKGLLKEYDTVVHIPMSSGLSGSCETAIMLAEDFDGKVQVVDNQRISVTQRQSVLDAIELVRQGHTAVQIRDFGAGQDGVKYLYYA